MKKYFIYFFLTISNTFIYSQTYLDNTPANYLFTLTKNDFQNENFISTNKIRRIYYIEKIKKDTSYVRTFDNKGRIIEEINYSEGNRNEKWVYDYQENKKSISMYRFQNNKLLNEKPDIWIFEFDKQMNLVFQKNLYRVGVEMSYKYLYDSNSNLILRENYVNNKMTNSFLYKYENNLLKEYISRRHFIQNGELKTFESEIVDYLYNENKVCTQIIAQSLNRKGIYNFKFLNKKLIEEV